MSIIRLAENQPNSHTPSPGGGAGSSAGGAFTQSERILVFAPTGRDGALVSHTLNHGGFEAVQCANFADFRRELDAGAAAMFIAEEALSLDAMNSLREALRNQPAWSDLPVIV